MQVDGEDTGSDSPFTTDVESNDGQDDSRMNSTSSPIRATRRIARPTPLPRAPVTQHSQHCYFIDGRGGTGKTFLLNLLLDKVRLLPDATGAHYCVAVATSSTGVTAKLLHGGRTAHTQFKISLDATHPSCNVTPDSQLGEFLRSASLIIWDEAAASNKLNVEAFNVLMQNITQNNHLFGGKVVVLGGDFRQTLPIVKKGTRADVVQICLNQSFIWDMLHKRQLIVNMRLAQAPAHLRAMATEYDEWLLNIGNGKHVKVFPGDAALDEYVEIPKELLLECQNRDPLTPHPEYSLPQQLIQPTEQDLIDFVYPNLAQQVPFSLQCMAYLQDRCILALDNANTERLNHKLIDIFPGELVELLSEDQMLKLDNDGSVPILPRHLREEHNPSNNLIWEDHFPIEVLNEQLPSGFPPHQLRLKLGMCVIILRNFDRRTNVANGTKAIVMRITRNALKLKLISTGEEVYLPRMVFIDDSGPLKMKRRQFPVRGAFAMTINKAQGQTLSHYGIYLQSNCFGHGQLYTALSRSNNPANVRILILSQSDLQPTLCHPNPDFQSASIRPDGTPQCILVRVNITKNIVYDTVLI